MLEAGVPLIYIRNFLGHESVSKTEVYVRVSQASLTKVLQERKLLNPIPISDKNTRRENEEISDFLKNAR